MIFRRNPDSAASSQEYDPNSGIAPYQSDHEDEEDKLLLN